MFNENKNNIQPEKKSYGKFGIFLAVFFILCITVFIYFYLVEKEPVETVSSPKVEKTEEDKLKEDMELINQGYVKSISGKIKEIDKENGKMIINTNSLNENEVREVSFNEKTEVIKTIYTPKKEEKTDEVIEDDENSMRGKEGDFSEETVLLSVNDLQEGVEIEAIFSEFVMLEKETNLKVVKIQMAEEKLAEENLQQEDNL